MDCKQKIWNLKKFNKIFKHWFHVFFKLPVLIFSEYEGKNFYAFIYCENCTKKLCYENVKELFRFLSFLKSQIKIKFHIYRSSREVRNVYFAVFSAILKNLTFRKSRTFLLGFNPFHTGMICSVVWVGESLFLATRRTRENFLPPLKTSATIRYLIVVDSMLIGKLRIWKQDSGMRQDRQLYHVEKAEQLSKYHVFWKFLEMTTSPPPFR